MDRRRTEAEKRIEIGRQQEKQIGGGVVIGMEIGSGNGLRTYTLHTCIHKAR